MKKQDYLDHLVGVFGHPVAENPGVVIQEAAFRALGLDRWRFLTIDVEPEKIADAITGLKAMKMRGINCTIPHKINVIPYLDELSQSARLIGAVNTIVNRPEDAHLAKSLMELLNRILPNNTFVTWDHAFAVPADTDILVNATSIGLYPNVDDIPNIDLDTILPTMFVQDVIPNPAITPFLRAAEARGARCNTGTGMLINQAALNIEMWTGLKPDKNVMLKALQEALS